MTMQRENDVFPIGRYVWIAVAAVVFMAALYWLTWMFNIAPGAA